MATLTFTYPDDAGPRVVEAFTNTFDYDPNSGVTKAAFTKARIADYIRETVRSYESGMAYKAAAATVVEPEAISVT